MRNKVFLSYARGDENAARELCVELEKMYLAGWMAESEIAVGDVWSKKIREALESSSLVAVFVSEHSLRNHWVQFELGAAFEMGKPIVPVVIGPRGLQPPLLDLLHGLQDIDARERSMSEVAREVARVVGLEASRPTRR